MRITKTDLDTPEDIIRDIWTTGEGDNEELSEEWIGSTKFWILKPKPPEGHKWIEGRLTRTQQITRPDNVWPEVWSSMTKKQKQEAQEEWRVVSSEREYARSFRSLTIFQDSENMCEDFSGVHIHGCSYYVAVTY